MKRDDVPPFKTAEGINSLCSLPLGRLVSSDTAAMIMKIHAMKLVWERESNCDAVTRAKFNHMDRGLISISTCESLFESQPEIDRQHWNIARAFAMEGIQATFNEIERALNSAKKKRARTEKAVKDAWKKAVLRWPQYGIEDITAVVMDDLDITKPTVFQYTKDERAELKRKKKLKQVKRK